VAVSRIAYRQEQQEGHGIGHDGARHSLLPGIGYYQRVPFVEIRIQHLDLHGLGLARDVLRRIANRPTAYGVDRVGTVSEEEQAVVASMSIGGDNSCQAAKAAVWKSLQDVMRARDAAAEDEGSLTERQLLCWPSD